MLNISTQNRSVILNKETQEGDITVIATNNNGVVEIVYIGIDGFKKKLKSASLLASRMISALMGADYSQVNNALRGVC